MQLHRHGALSVHSALQLGARFTYQVQAFLRAHFSMVVYLSALCMHLQGLREACVPAPAMVLHVSALSLQLEVHFQSLGADWPGMRISSGAA